MIPPTVSSRKEAMFMFGAYIGIVLIVMGVVVGAAVMSFGVLSTFVGCVVLILGLAFIFGMGYLFVWLDQRDMKEDDE